MNNQPNIWTSKIDMVALRKAHPWIRPFAIAILTFSVLLIVFNFVRPLLGLHMLFWAIPVLLDGIVVSVSLFWFILKAPRISPSNVTVNKEEFTEMIEQAVARLEAEKQQEE